MGIFPGLSTAASTMNNASTSMKVISDNLANLGTPGFKQSRTLSSDSFASLLPSGGPGDQVGNGASRVGIQRIVTKGKIEPSNNILDSAIDGEGFFILNNGLGGQVYTRGGTFTLNDQGVLIHTPTKLEVQTFPAAGGTALGNVTLIGLNNLLGSATTNLSFVGNLSAQENILGTAGSFLSSLKRDEFVVSTGVNDQLVFDVGGGPITASLVTHGGLTSGTAVIGNALANAVKLALETQNGSLDAYTVTYDLSTDKFTIKNDNGNTTPITFRHDLATSTASSLLGFAAAASSAIQPNSTEVSNLGVAFNVLTGVNDTLSVNFNGVPATVTVAAGNYTGGGLARAIEASLQGTSALNRSASVTYDELLGTFRILGPQTGGAYTINQPSNSGTPTIAVAATQTTVTGGTLSATASFSTGSATAGTGNFDITDPFKTSSSNSTHDAFDSLGNQRSMTTFFRKVGDNIWEWHAAFQGSDLVGPTLNTSFEEIASGLLTFDSDGKLDTEANTAGTGIVNFDAIGTNPPPAQGQIIAFDFGDSLTTDTGTGLLGMTQFGGPFNIVRFDNNGVSQGSFLVVNIDESGFINALFNNNQTIVLGQIALARFPVPAELTALGDSIFSVSPESGAATVTAPNQNGTGRVLPGALEISNVEISEQFVDLIVQQEIFQANARLVTATDEMLQTLINL
ncbi:MAG: flagellar hook-basal body complex protein [bacterium]|nr:flagellar hook-basal body complex protein [bacterium]